MKKKICIVFFLLLIQFSKIYCQAGGIVHDPVVNVSIITDWLAGLDRLYQMYDQTMNQIEMIQQNYERMQYYIDRAASFEWKDIQWDGDLDFRNEIRDATRQVDRQLTNVRKIRDTFTRKTVTMGNQTFSFASLCGIPDDKNGNIHDLVSAAADYYGEGFAYAGRAWRNQQEITESEAATLWHRYGLTPENYYMVREVEKKLDEKLAYLIGQTEDDLKELNERDQEFYGTITNIMAMAEQQDITEPELAQINLMLEQQTIIALKDLQHDLQQGMSVLAWKTVYERQEQAAKEQSEKERLQKMNKRSLPDHMKY